MPRQAESRRRWARRPVYAVLRATGLVGLLALAGWVPAAGQEGAEARVNADLNFREECGMSAPVLRVLTPDEVVTVLGEELGGWVRVRDEEGVEGCVSAEYLAIEETTVTDSGMMSSPSAEPEPYGWADLADPDSTEIVAEIEELERELAATSDPDEQEELRQEIAELEDDLRARQEALVEEREEQRLAASEEAREQAEAAEETRRDTAEGSEWDDRQPGSWAHAGDADWTGFYAGVNAGYGFGDEVTASNNLGTSPEGDIDGIDGGVQIGYGHQFNGFVLGFEGDYEHSNQSGATDLSTVGFPGSSAELSYETYYTARIRAGVVAGRVLVYGTGGYAQADVESRFSGPISDLVMGSSTSVEGLAYGVGAEILLTGSFSLKGEALVHDFDDEPEFGADDPRFFIARVGVNWRP